MKLEKILGWIDGLLECGRFDDVSNNGLQIARDGDDISKVAFAVDGSVKSVKAAADAGAQLLVVHHGISWGGGIRRITGGEYNVVKAAMDANLALAGYHLPLDANKKVGNNWELARYFKLTDIRPAFNYHGNVIGLVGECLSSRVFECLSGLGCSGQLKHFQLKNSNTLTMGICSGGAGEFAAEAKALGCDLYVTGEASWGDVIAAENIGMPMVCAGHYETETFGVKALMKAMKKALKVGTVFVSLLLCAYTGEAESLPLQGEEDLSSAYVGVSGALLLPQGGSRMPMLGGAAFNGGYYLNRWFAAEAEVAWMENRGAAAVRALVHFNGLDLWDRLFGFSRWDPFFSLGVCGWFPDGQVGPAAGIGLLYYLDDNWALRFGGEATFGVDGEAEMIYSLTAGVQYSW